MNQLFIKHSLIVLLVLLGLFIAGCLAFWALVLSGRHDVSADGDHWALTERVLIAARENAVARQARAIDARLPSLDVETARFEAVIGFEDMCAACHAPPERGPSALARGLNPPAPDLARAALERSPEELFWVTRHGIRMTGMPAWGVTHSDAELWSIVALVLEFPDLGGEGYERLLAAAKAAGMEHEHDHDHDHGNGHGNDYGREQNHEHNPDHERDHEHDHEHDHLDPQTTGEHDHEDHNR